MLVAILASALAAVNPQVSPPPSLPSVPNQERQVLMELFTVTAGQSWTKRDGWGTSLPVCDWHGVSCDFVEGDANRPVVAGLSLARNNLAGTLPASLSELQHLKSLEVSRNRLTGDVPEALLQRWDTHQFEFSGEGNSFSSAVVSATLEYSASGILCAVHDDVWFRLDVDGASGRTVFQSVRCVDNRPADMG